MYFPGDDLKTRSLDVQQMLPLMPMPQALLLALPASMWNQLKQLWKEALLLPLPAKGKGKGGAEGSRGGNGSGCGSGGGGGTKSATTSGREEQVDLTMLEDQQPYADPSSPMQPLNSPGVAAVTDRVKEVELKGAGSSRPSENGEVRPEMFCQRFLCNIRHCCPYTCHSSTVMLSKRAL